MQNLLLSAISLFLLLILALISRFIGNKVSIYRRVAKYIAYLTFIFLIIFGIYTYLEEKPRIYTVESKECNYLITFPGKPEMFDVENAEKRLTVKRGKEEYTLVYKTLIEDNSIIELTDRYDLKLESNNIVILNKELNIIDSYYVLSAVEDGFYIFKKFVLHEGLLLDITIKSQNRFPSEKEKKFLDYEIQEK